MGVERANLDDGPGGLGYALVELVGKFLFVAAAWRGLEERQWLLWTEEEDAVMMGHFSSKSGRFARFERPCILVRMFIDLWPVCSFWHEWAVMVDVLFQSCLWQSRLQKGRDNSSLLSSF